MAGDGASREVKFCSGCGESTEGYLGARYCPHCGEELLAPASPTTSVVETVPDEEDEPVFGSRRVWPWWVAVAFGLGLMFSEPSNPDAPTTLELLSSDIGAVIVVVAGVRLFLLRRRRRKAEEAYLRDTGAQPGD